MVRRVVSTILTQNLDCESTSETPEDDQTTTEDKVKSCRELHDGISQFLAFKFCGKSLPACNGF